MLLFVKAVEEAIKIAISFPEPSPFLRKLSINSLGTKMHVRIGTRMCSLGLFINFVYMFLEMFVAIK